MAASFSANHFGFRHGDIFIFILEWKMTELPCIVCKHYHSEREGCEVTMTKWRKMNSAPRDGTPILVGLWVKHYQMPEPFWEQYVVYFHAETETAYQQNFVDLPWAWGDFQAWTVIPKPPSWGKND